MIYVLFLRAHKKDFFRQAGHWKGAERELNRRNSLVGLDFYTLAPGKSKSVFSIDHPESIGAAFVFVILVSFDIYFCYFSSWRKERGPSRAEHECMGAL